MYYVNFLHYYYGNPNDFCRLFKVRYCILYARRSELLFRFWPIEILQRACTLPTEPFFQDILLFLNIAHQVREVLTNRIREVTGLSLERAVTLWVISREEGEVTTSGLAKTLGRSSHTVSTLVDTLERQSLVIRGRDSSTDRRQVRVQITSMGVQKVDQFLDDMDSLTQSVVVERDGNPANAQISEAIRTLVELLCVPY